MASLKQIRAMVAVTEEGSFTAAAVRENATQSGISQHVAALESDLGTPLFARSRDGVSTTPAGRLYYQHCVQALRELETGRDAVARLLKEVGGNLHVGLMPAFTRAALAPALEHFAAQYPGVAVRLTEAYSGSLTEMVLAGELDFALVPAASPIDGLTVEHLSRDQEFLVSGHRAGLTPLAPVRLRELDPIKLIVPSTGNVRRRNLDTYLETHGIRVARRLEMDAMIATLEMVARTDWLTILPGLICIADVGGRDRCLNPIVAPPLYAEYVVIQPARRPLSRQADLFVAALRNEVGRIDQRWQLLLRP